jgi:hypothetical protein
MKKIIINYKNTGIQTLRGTAYFILGAGSLATLLAFINCFESTGRYSGDVKFVWAGLISVLLIFSATLFLAGICFALAYLSESAFVSRKQREELLIIQGIELKFLEREESIRVKNKESGWVYDVTLSTFEKMKAEHGEENYEILEQN